MEKRIFKFPDNFLWGTATAGHQVEGNNKYSDWWHWEKSQPGIEKSGIACDHYHRYKEDFRLAKNVLYNNAHRLSIEWARIEPKEGKINPRAILHYKNVLTELKSLGLTSMVTLHHFVNPLWFSEKGGWKNKKNIYFFEKYVWTVVDSLGSLIDYWIVINEPSVYTIMSYIQGIWTPQKRSLKDGISVYSNLATAHSKAYKIIHTKFPQAQVSSSLHSLAYKKKGVIGRLLEPISKYISNYSFLKLTRNCHDFVGINYYGLHVSSWRDFFIKNLKGENIEDIMNWFQNYEDAGLIFSGELLFLQQLS